MKPSWVMPTIISRVSFEVGRKDFKDDFKGGANKNGGVEILHTIGVSTLETRAILSKFILSS